MNLFEKRDLMFLRRSDPIRDNLPGRDQMVLLGKLTWLQFKAVIIFYYGEAKPRVFKAGLISGC